MNLPVDFYQPFKLIVVFKIETNVDEHFRALWKNKRKAYQVLLDYSIPDRGNNISKIKEIMGKFINN